MDITVVILAAGQGTRMRSDIPKVLHSLCGIPMIEHIVKTVRKLDPAKIHLVVGYKEELVREHFGESLSYVTQSEQLGTGHAVLQASEALSNHKGDVIVLYGDVPLVTEETLRSLVQKHSHPVHRPCTAIAGGAHESRLGEHVDKIECKLPVLEALGREQ